MVARSLALVIPFVMPLVVGGCFANTHQTPDSSLTSTTQSTSANYDEHFRLSDEIYSRCQIASRPNMDIAESTAWCLKTGPLNGAKIQISGYKDEAKVARDRLVSYGVDPARIQIVHTSQMATLEVIRPTLGKQY